MAGLDEEETRGLYMALREGRVEQEFEFMCNFFYQEGLTARLEQ